MRQKELQTRAQETEGARTTILSMSKSHQTCSCCGWSKVTSYQGLRIHQGKMGCTPKGLSIPESVYNQYSPLSYDSSSSSSSSYSQPAVAYTPTPVKNEIYSSYSSYSQPAVPYTPAPVKKEIYSSYSSFSEPAVPYTSTPVKKETYATVTPEYDPPSSTKNSSKPAAETQGTLRSCHCGWSKVTSYQGLRIHQGKMGCTPKGLGIPENQQGLFNPSAPKIEATPAKPREKPRIVNDTTPNYNPKPSSKTSWDTTVEELKKVQANELSARKEKPPVTRPKPAPKPRSTPDTTGASLKKDKSSFETPQQCRPSTGDGAKTRRALDFSAREKQDTEDLIKAQIQSREQKVSEVRSCLKAGKASLDEDWKEINRVFAEVIEIVEEARDRELKSLEVRRVSLRREADSLIGKIRGEIEELEDALYEVDFGADVHKALLTMKPEDYSLSSPFDFGTLQMTISTMMDQIQQELDQLSARDLKRVASFAADVEFAPSGAPHWLAVLHSEKKIQDGGQSWQFSKAKAGFTSGRAYWKVQVGGESGWALGVASAKADHVLTLSTDHGYRAIAHHEGEKRAAHTAPPVCLQLKDRPQSVGVFLDYEQGLLSFYNVTKKSHIYSFTECAFTGSISPYIHI